MSMFGKSPGLDKKIAAEIAAKGPITFARFMEMALYDPEEGYYAAGKAEIGRGGDFYTNVSVGPVFGWLLAQQFEEIWNALGRPDPFFVVEQGAHDGRLAADILSVAAGPFAQSLQYVLVESSPLWRKRQEQALAGGGSLRWVPETAELGPFQGVVFCNELIDAFPFHLLRSKEEGWSELRVAEESGALVFREAETSKEAAAEASRLPPCPPGALAEVRPAASAWLKGIASMLQRGFVLIADYGDEADALFGAGRPFGTFACYRNHRRDEQPLEKPGTKDITAHVDFTSLAFAAREAGFQALGLADQYHYLGALARPLLQAAEGRAGSRPLRQLNTLLHPQLMGRAFKFFCLGKNLEEIPSLSGFADRPGSVAVNSPPG